jgi:hypothetical protein
MMGGKERMLNDVDVVRDKGICLEKEEEKLKRENADSRVEHRIIKKEVAMLGFVNGGLHWDHTSLTAQNHRLVKDKARLKEERDAMDGVPPKSVTPPISFDHSDFR